MIYVTRLPVIYYLTKACLDDRWIYYYYYILFIIIYYSVIEYINEWMEITVWVETSCLVEFCALSDFLVSNTNIRQETRVAVARACDPWVQDELWCTTDTDGVRAAGIQTHTFAVCVCVCRVLFCRRCVFWPVGCVSAWQEVAQQEQGDDQEAEAAPGAVHYEDHTPSLHMASEWSRRSPCEGTNVASGIRRQVNIWRRTITEIVEKNSCVISAAMTVTQRFSRYLTF